MTLKKKKESWLVGRRHLSPSTHGDMQRLKRDSPKLESFAPSSCLNRDVAELQRKGGSSSLQPDSCPFPGLMTGKKKAGLTVVFRVGDTSLTTAATSGRVPAPACRLPGPPSPSLPPSSLLPPPLGGWLEHAGQKQLLKENSAPPSPAVTFLLWLHWPLSLGWEHPRRSR